MTLLDFVSVDDALGRLRSTGSVAKYLWLLSSVRQTDVTNDRDFQKAFNHYYRVQRRGADWYSAFYSVFEQAKDDTGVDFPAILGIMQQQTGRLEASFSSKIIATLNSGKPVIDRFVLERLGLRLPYHYQQDRFKQTVQVYNSVKEKLNSILASPKWPVTDERFDAVFPEASGISPMKKLDFILWQSRSR